MFGIPVPGYRDGIWPEIELQKWQMVENFMLASMHGVTTAVFNEGNISLWKEDDGTYTAAIEATGTNPSVSGMVGGAYFVAPSYVKWDKMEEGKTYYLYLRGTSKTFADPSEVRPVVSSTKLTDSASVLVSKAVIKGDTSHIECDPDGKVSTCDLLEHLNDNDNPHTRKLIQDEILVVKRLVLGDENPISVEVGTDKFTSSDLKSALSIKTVVIDFKTGGKDGAVLSVGGRVMAANASRMAVGGVVGAGVLGEVAIGYNGTDSLADTPDKLVVRNSGDAGISMRAVVTLG